MALRPLIPVVKEQIIPGWEVMVTEAGRTGRGLKATLVLLNGEPKACHSIALGYAPEQNQFAEAVYNLCGADEVIVKALLPKLAYIVEDVLRQMATRSAKDEDQPGSSLTFEEPDPWDTPVDGADLLKALVQVFARYLILPPGAATALALWTLHAYTYDAGNITPRLGIVSPQKRCGKTRVLEVLSLLTPRVLMSSNASSAAVFRAIELWQPTLLIDEADTSLPGNEELRGILNSGHTRRTAYVLRTVGEDHEPRRFSTWAPLAIAMIGALPGTLADRSIVLSMRRKKREETVDKLPTDDTAAPFADLRRQCTRWAADHVGALQTCTPSMPDRLHDRATDNWYPLCAIAHVVGGGWPERTKQAIQALMANAPEDDETGVLLLRDIQQIFRERQAERIFSEDLASALHKMEGRPWPEYGKHRKPISPNQIARLLKPYEIYPKTLRDQADRAKGYHLEDCQDAFSRYIPADPPFSNRDIVTNEQPCGFEPKSMRDTIENVTDEKTCNPASDNGCHGVTDGKGGSGEKIETEPAPAFQDFVACVLWCTTCQQAQPVEENPPELLCAICGTVAGIKTYSGPQASARQALPAACLVCGATEVKAGVTCEWFCGHCGYKAGDAGDQVPF